MRNGAPYSGAAGWNPSDAPSRRRFLSALAGALAAVFVGSSPGAGDRRRPDGMSRPASGISPVDVDSLPLVDTPGTRLVGRAYLEVTPEERDPQVLGRRLLRRVAREEGDQGAPPGVALERCIRGDFRCGDTVVLDGWVLSRTEARLCALPIARRSGGTSPAGAVRESPLLGAWVMGGP